MKVVRLPALRTGRLYPLDALDVRKLLSWKENRREYEEGFKLWISLLKARTNGAQIVIEVRFTAPPLPPVRSVRRHSGKQKK